MNSCSKRSFDPIDITYKTFIDFLEADISSLKRKPFFYMCSKSILPLWDAPLISAAQFASGVGHWSIRGKEPVTADRVIPRIKDKSMCVRLAESGS